MTEVMLPALVLMLGAVLIGVLKGGLRSAVVLLAPLLTLWAIWQVPDGVSLTVPFLDFRAEPLEGSALGRLFATVFALMALMGGLFSYRQASALELASSYAYAASAVGIAFAGDLLTLFVFWEAMAIFSTVVVWCGGTDSARRAGVRYAIVHLLGGVLLMVGIAGVVFSTGSIDIQPMRADSFATWLVLIGVLVNAAAPPFSFWLPDAYPEASPTGAVFLSAFTTKSAVLALIVLFPGEPILIAVGLYMIFYGIIYALLENDARRILAYSIVNQVGFMVCAVGIGTELALNGAAAHAFAHIIYKALLLMSAGVVLYRTQKRKCTDLGGLFRTMPVTCICGIIGALSISSFPLTSGFTTKALISEASKVEGMAAVYFLLAAASAGVFLHAGIKFPWFVFFQKDSGMRPPDAPWNMGAAMVLMSVFCLVLGIWPGWFYALLPYPVDYQAYTAGNVLFYLQLLLFSGLAFFLLLPMMKRTTTITLDWDWLWRVWIYRRMQGLSGVWDAAMARFGRLFSTRLYPALGRTAAFWHSGGVFSRSWTIGTTALWIAVLLSAYVFIYYI